MIPHRTPFGQKVEDPTPEEIRARCLLIQETWGELEWARRRGLKFNPRAISSVRMGLVTHRIACDVAVFETE